MKISGYLRVTWALLSVFVVESVVFGLAVLPAVLFWEWHFHRQLPSAALRILFVSMAFIPAYLLFTLALIVLSGLATRLTGWRTPREAQIDIRCLAILRPEISWCRHTLLI